MALADVLTYQDLLQFRDDGLRRELIDGELFVSASPYLRHQRIVGFLHVELMAACEHGLGTVYVGPADVVFSETNVLVPDLLFIAPDQPQIETEANVQGAPALVVEVVSNPRYDKIRKRDLYARFGVAEYWAVDPRTETVYVFRHDGTGYGDARELRAGDTLTYDRLPALRIDVTKTFAV